MDDRINPKTIRLVWQSKQKDVWINDWGIEIQLFPLHCGLIDVIIKIYSNYVMSKEILTLKRKTNESWHWTLNKSIVTVEINHHISTLINKQILAFVVVKTHAILLPFGAILANAIALNSWLPTTWTNQKQRCYAKTKCIIKVDHYKYVTN